MFVRTHGVKRQKGGSRKEGREGGRTDRCRGALIHRVPTLPSIRIQFCSSFLEHRRQNHNHGFIMDPQESDGERKRDPVDLFKV